MAYNGWTNYETWLVNVWMTNECGLVENALEHLIEEEKGLPREKALRHWVEDAMLPEVSGLASDLLSGALDSVNWGEIVDAITEQLEEVEQ